MKTSKFVKERAGKGIGTTMSTIQGAKPTSIDTAHCCGVRRVEDGVMLTISYPQASIVQVAGDFNNWQPERTPMKRTSDGTWQIKLPLTEGVYRYRLVVDGHWQHDPHNEATEPNPYGELNSILKVNSK